VKECIELDGLLVSGDPQVLSVMNRILDGFGIKAESCGDFILALDAVRHGRLDTVVVDWNSSINSIRVVSAVRKSSSNSNSTIVAMVSGRSETQAALLAGANFIVHKPTTFERAHRCMRAAHGAMIQQRRRSARCPTNIPVVATVAELGRVEARLIDISVGGFALRCNQQLKPHWTVAIKFLLPGTSDLVHVMGKVVNANGTGRAGISTSSIPEDDFNRLIDWLATESFRLADGEFHDIDSPEN
jgi:PilZ domain-containing protein